MTPARNRSAWSLLLPVWQALGVFFPAPLVPMRLVSSTQRGTYGGIEPVRDLGAYLRSGDFAANYVRSLGGIYLGIGWRSLWEDYRRTPSRALATLQAALDCFAFPPQGIGLRPQPWAVLCRPVGPVLIGALSDSIPALSICLHARRISRGLAN